MLTKYRVKNLATVVDGEIDLGRLVRISGANDAGKSMTFFSPLEACLFHNKIDSDNIRYGTKQAEVTIEWSDGRKLVRTVTASKQTTVLHYADGTVSKPITLFKDCQDQVQKFTGFKNIRVSDGKETLNEWLQVIPISAPQIDYIENVSPAKLLKRVTAVTGGGEITAAKVKVEKELRATIEKRKAAEANAEYFSNLLLRLEEKTEPLQLQDCGIQIELSNYVHTPNGKFNPERFIQEAVELRKLRDSVVVTYTTGIVDLTKPKEALDNLRTHLESLQATQTALEDTRKLLKEVSDSETWVKLGTVYIDMHTSKITSLEKQLAETQQVCEKCGQPI
jgi:hypothetical protein